jgi:hypothetical protein
MNPIRLTILGAGTVRCMLPLVSSLATYFGERPLEIVFFDADEERLDLVDRLARMAFMATKASHSLRSTYDPDEALEEADLVVLQIGENCARKMFTTRRDQPDPIDRAVALLLQKVPAEAHLMSLVGEQIPYDGYFAMDWPPELSFGEEVAVPHQILRYLNQEEYLFEILKQYQSSPLKAWLNDPTAKMRQPWAE